MTALLMALSDVGSNVKDRRHIVSMDGSWMLFTYGFAGVWDDDGTLSLRPRRAPDANPIRRFPGTDRHETEEIRLTRDHPIASRRISAW
jgi:trehalose/maltose hydrolase-like predicted phosphorylase